MKKVISVVLTLVIAVTCCLSSAASEANDMEYEFSGFNDSGLYAYLEEEIYRSLINELGDGEYFIENISTTYISEEYLEEVAYNSKANIYFGYNLSDVEAMFKGTKYVFSLGEDGNTSVKEFEEYDDTFDQVLRNVAIGGGVILVCVTVSVVTAGAGAVAISAIFATAAQAGTIQAITCGAFSGVAAGIVTGIETGDVDEAFKSAALAGSEGFKWGAITGAVTGGISEAVALKGATLNGLTMNEAAAIQKETKWSLDFIKNIHSVEEANIYKTAGLKCFNFDDGLQVLAQDIDWNLVDDLGRTNVQRVLESGLAPIDNTGIPFEIHHVGQQNDGLYAILTKAEHMQGGNNKILHYVGGASEVDHGTAWSEIKTTIWKAIFELQNLG